jgi:hypothetical protein
VQSCARASSRTSDAGDDARGIDDDAKCGTCLTFLEFFFGVERDDTGTNRTVDVSL